MSCLLSHNVFIKEAGDFSQRIIVVKADYAELLYLVILEKISEIF